jgi:uncharacterized protein YutE (UPF0331/DUF86 family)
VSEVNLDRLRELAGHLRDAVRQLRELGQAPRERFVAELRTRLMRMARFRNLLVHLYARVDDGEVHRVIRDDLADLERYLASVGRYLKAEI